MSDFNPSSYVGGAIASVGFEETLAPPTADHICRLCGDCDREWLGYSRMRVQDGFGSVDFYKCHRCDGTGVEPQGLIWDGTWWKPWTWFAFHRDWKD
jgi:hypothetical protein